MANKKGGLGKGMSSLFGANNVSKSAVEHTKSATKEPTATENVVQLNLSAIKPNPFQPRRHFDETKLQELATSVQDSGVLTPIIVREDGKSYQIIAGERRVRASRLAKLTTIPAIVRQVDDDTMAAVALIENLQRDDLNVIEEAQAFDALMTRLSLSQAQLAEKVGKDRATVANALRLLKLPENVQTMLQDGELSMGQARALLGLKKKSQIDKVVATIMARGLNVRQVEALVKQINEAGGEPAASEKPQISPFIAAVATQLEEKFGTKVKVNTATKGNGKIEINYVSNDDLSRILALLNIEVD